MAARFQGRAGPGAVCCRHLGVRPLGGMLIFSVPVVVGGIIIHGWWLPKHGINGWTGEPRDKYLELVGARKRPTA